MRIAPSLISVFLLASPALAAGKVWVVDDDGGPGVHATSIAAAVAAATEGDLVLVRPGSYEIFTLDKALTITADLGADVRLRCSAPCTTGWVSVDSVLAPKWIVLRGLRAEALPTADQISLLVNASAPLFVEDCEFHRVFANPFSQLTLVRTQLHPPLVAPVTLASSGVLMASQCQVQVHECTIDGPPSEGSISGYEGAAAAGIYLASARLHAVRTSARGCDAYGCTTVPGGPFGIQCVGTKGGPGLHMSATSEALLAACTFTGGNGSNGGTPCPSIVGSCGSGPSGSTSAGGTTTTVPGAGGVLKIDSPIRFGQTAALTVGGDVGSFAVALYSFQHFPWLQLGLGSLLVPPLFGTQTFLQPLGAIGASGTLSTSVGIGSIPAGNEFLQIFVQGAFVTPSGVITLGSGSVLNVLQAGF
jgi:hypothetical protein